MFVESVLFPSETLGSTYSYAGPGDFHIKVNALGSWEITIKLAP